MFCKGQKVIRCGHDYSEVVVGGIYTVKRYAVTILEFEEVNYNYNKNYFQTMIQSIDDVVPGMELTIKRPLYDGMEMREVGDKIIVKHILQNGTIISKNNSYIFIRDFKEYKPKEKEENLIKAGVLDAKYNNIKVREMKEYRVVGDGFTILEIYKKRPLSCQDFNKEFEALLEEERQLYVDSPFRDYEDISNSKVLMRNLSWLEQKGFIKERVKDVVLKPGMRVKSSSGNIYLLIEAEGTGSLHMILDNKSYNVNNDLKVGITLRELRNRLSTDYEVVNE